MASYATSRPKRSAACRAEGKIKKTLDEIKGWSVSSSDASSAPSDVCHRLSDFDDLHGDSNKKPRTEGSNQNEAKMSATAKSDASSNEPALSEDAAESEQSKAHKEDSSQQTATTDPSSPDSPSSSTSSILEEFLNTAEAQRAYREQRARARNQHSDGPMILSRRLSWKLSKAEPSPSYSPIEATRLLFTPADATRTN